jgi:hypothetical protein
MIYTEIREQTDHTLYYQLKSLHRSLVDKKVFKIVHEIPITKIEPLCNSLLVPWTESPQQSYQLNENCDLKTRTLAQKTHIFAKKT